MANVFKNSVTGSIGITNTRVYQTPALSVSTVIGMSVSNVISNNISVNVTVTDASATQTRFLVRNGLIIGISSRGMGSLKEVSGVMEVQDDFELLTWDLVSNPSNPDSWMKNGSLNESRSTFLDPYAKTNSIVTEILCAKGTCPLF